MKSNYELRARKFIAELFPYLDGCYRARDYQRAASRYMIDHPHRKVNFCYGIARVVFVTSDYVIKIDYDDYGVSAFGGCENELRFYSIAERDGMAYLFAKISYYSYMNRDFYIMPRVYGIGRYEDSDAHEYMIEAESDWCEEHGVGDLHEYNYGWYKDRPIIIDYGASL